MKSREVRARVIEDLERSGLSAHDVSRLKIEPLTPDQTSAIFHVNGSRRFFKAAAYRLVYFSIEGAPTDFFRVRFLDEVLGAKGKAIRYAQQPDTDPHAYFPPYVDWVAIKDDVGRAIVITEGEKKAAKACKEGINCLGLGGVWSFRSKKRGQDLIDDLAQIAWLDRKVLIVFDTDPDPKPEVEGAVEALGRVLESRGALVSRLLLPLEKTGAKIGLDDYLRHHSRAELLALPEQSLHSSALLEVFNQETAVVYEPPAVVELGTLRLHRTPETLIKVTYANRLMTKVTSAGNLAETNAFKEWLAWPRRRQHTRLVYEPGQPRVIKADNALNLWTGWGVPPKKGDVSLFLKLLDYLFEGEKEARRWIGQWLAYPLQHPGTKLYTAVVLWSRGQGTGKTLLGMALKLIYGDNWAMIGNEDLHGAFNDWQAQKQFILGEEITSSDKRTETDRIKRIITSETVRVNRKFEPAYEVKHVANYLFTTNHPNAFDVDETDRRLLVHCVDGPTQPSESWFTTEFDPWFKSQDGASAIFHHLLSVDLTGFSPRSKAPMTRAKGDMAALSGAEVDRLARAVRDAPDYYLKLGESTIQRAVATLDEIAAILDPDGTRRLSPVALGRALSKAGLRSLVVNLPGKGVHRLYAIRDKDRWQRANHAELVAEYTGNNMINKKEKF